MSSSPIDDFPKDLLIFLIEYLSNLDSSSPLSQRNLKSLALASHRYYGLALPKIYHRTLKENSLHFRATKLLKKSELVTLIETIASKNKKEPTI